MSPLRGSFKKCEKGYRGYKEATPDGVGESSTASDSSMNFASLLAKNPS
jgi:hypothetical protein